jgi:peptidoglycan-associated lipoprotein
MIRILSLVLPLLMLHACSSGVKLNEVPVEDRSATTVSSDASATPAPAVPAAGATTGPAGGGTGQGSRSAVAPVDLTRSTPAATGQPTPSLVYFDYDSFVIKAEFAAVIEAHAKHLKADRNRKAAIEGHTDDRGGREYNLALGQRRAEAVRRALALLGVPDAQMEAVSFGKEKPAVQGASEAAFARNRRAEIAYR